MLAAVLDLIQVDRLKAFLGDNKLVLIPSGHHIPLHRLALSADVVAVQIGVEIEHSLDKWERLIDHQVILIENMMGQRLGVAAQQLRAEGAAVDGEQLVEFEGLGFRPVKYLMLRQGVGIADGAVTLAVGVLVIVVGDEQIHPAAFLALFQGVQEPHIVPADPVIAVHHLKIPAFCVLNSLVDARSVAAVFLVDGGDDVGVFFGISVSDF